MQEEAIDRSPFWRFEQNIKLVNEIVEEEENNQKKQEQESSSNFDTNSVMKNAQNMSNNIPKPPKY